MSLDPAVEALIADGTWNASPLGACGVRRMVRGRVAEGLVRLVREADAAVMSPDREKLIEAAAIEAADFLPAYPDGGRTARACAERVLAGAGFFDLFDRPAEPEREPVIHHVCGDDCSAPAGATDPVRAAAKRLIAEWVKAPPACPITADLIGAIGRLRAALAADREPEPEPVQSVRVALKTARECLEYLLDHHTDGDGCLCGAARAVAAAGLSLALFGPPEGEKP